MQGRNLIEAGPTAAWAMTARRREDSLVFGKGNNPCKRIVLLFDGTEADKFCVLSILGLAVQSYIQLMEEFQIRSRQTQLYLTLGTMEDIKNVHYCSKDPIANLKVRVTLTRISALKRKPKFGEQVRHLCSVPLL